jgi:excinuclease UvrABC ATPase subunit
MPNLGRPDVDALDDLSAAIIVDQERMGANARSTVGTAACGRRGQRRLGWAAKNSQSSSLADSGASGAAMAPSPAAAGRAWPMSASS